MKYIIILILTISVYAGGSELQRNIEYQYKKTDVEATVTRKYHAPDTRKCVFYATGGMSCTGYPEVYCTEISYNGTTSINYEPGIYNQYNIGDKYPCTLLEVFSRETGKLLDKRLIGR